MTASPLVLAYAITVVVLVTVQLLLWAYSGVRRSASGKAVNPEDARQFGSTFDPAEPDPVARVLRCHANGVANIYPFLFLGLVYVLLGGPLRFGQVVFGAFVVVRIAYVFAYLGGRQPWRSLIYFSGAIATAVLAGDLAYLLIRR